MTRHLGAAAVAIGTVALVVGSIGVADASNGGSLILGHKNTATKTTTIKDTKGTPLKLKGSKTKPPLKVNSTTTVKKLNVSLLDGADAFQLAAKGRGASIVHPLGGTSLTTATTSATPLATTGTLTVGTYFLQGTSEIATTGLAGSFCFFGVNGDLNPDDALQFGATPPGGTSSSSDDYAEATATMVLTVTTPESITWSCRTSGTAAVSFASAITAQHIDNFIPGSTPAAHRATRTSNRHGFTAAGIKR